MNHIANRNLRFSWEEDGAYRETLSLLENGEALPVLRSAPYASVFTDPRMYFPYLQEHPAGRRPREGRRGRDLLGASGLQRHPLGFVFRK